MPAIERIGVIGAGAWGTALGQAAVQAGREVRLWARRPELAAAINQRHENPDLLAGVALNPALAASAELGAVAGWAEALLLVTPTQSLREVATKLQPHLAPGLPLVICCKGLERASGLLPSQVLGEVLPGQPLLVLSGPSFARELADGLPTAVTLAGEDAGLCDALAEALGGPSFRPYRSDDPIGAQLGGALKNVIAIACGIVAGRGLGENARAAVITRGLAEVVRAGRARGGRLETFMGLSGLGDLPLSCTSATSRNYAFGLALGRAADPAMVLDVRHPLTEGRYTAAAAVELGRQLSLELPIAAAVDAVINQGASIEATIESLMARPLKAEWS
jgi:glycerol-3-phosphate dehydrogenase (NAD(P)+)